MKVHMTLNILQTSINDIYIICSNNILLEDLNSNKQQHVAQRQEINS